MEFDVSPIEVTVTMGFIDTFCLCCGVLDWIKI